MSFSQNPRALKYMEIACQNTCKLLDEVGYTEMPQELQKEVTHFVVMTQFEVIARAISPALAEVFLDKGDDPLNKFVAILHHDLEKVLSVWVAHCVEEIQAKREMN